MPKHNDDEQPPLFPEHEPQPGASPESHEPAEVTGWLTMSQLRQQARLRAATKASGGAQAELLRRLGDAPNTVVPYATLRAEGFPEDVIAACAQDDPDDKRRKRRVAHEFVGPNEVCWLTPLGLNAIGRQRSSVTPPTAESVAHATAPNALAGWLNKTLSTWPDLPRVSVSTGLPVREWAEQVKASAWARIQGVGDATGVYGPLTGGLYPDALLVERWRKLDLYEHAWGKPPETPQDAAEQLLGLEIEMSRKGDAPLAHKVRRWSGVLELGAAIGVVWVVNARIVADNLLALGVGTPAHPRQFLVPAAAVGLDGDPMPDLVPTWWPLRLSGGAA